MARNLLLAAFLLAVGLAGTTFAQDGNDERRVTLQQLLDAAREQIDQAQAVRDAVAADPANIIGLATGGSIVAIDRRDVDSGITLAAALAHEIVTSSPTAAAMVNDLIGNTVGSALERTGFSAQAAGFLGSLVGDAAQAIGVSAEILTEERLRDQIASRVNSRLDAAALTLAELDTEIATRWDLYDAIQSAMNPDEDGQVVADAKPPGDGNGSGITAGGWTAELGAIVEDRTDGLVVQPYGDGLTAYFEAPAAYLGDWRGRTQLTFERMSEGGDYYGAFEWGGDGDVVILNGGLKASYVIASDHTGSWGSFTVPLDGSGWTYDGGSFDDILADVTEFRIRAEYGVGADMSGLRNVVLN
ncbi:MAG: laminin B domain-containing protein [Pseudomonadota bacterium]